MVHGKEQKIFRKMIKIDHEFGTERRRGVGSRRTIHHTSTATILEDAFDDIFRALSRSVENQLGRDADTKSVENMSVFQLCFLCEIPNLQ